MVIDEISNSLSLIVNKYGNILLAGDVNINLLDPSSDTKNHLSDLRDTFALINLVDPSTSNMVNGSKHRSKLNDSTFTIFIDLCEDN